MTARVPFSAATVPPLTGELTRAISCISRNEKTSCVMEGPVVDRSKTIRTFSPLATSAATSKTICGIGRHSKTISTFEASSFAETQGIAPLVTKRSLASVLLS